MDSMKPEMTVVGVPALEKALDELRRKSEFDPLFGDQPHNVLYKNTDQPDAQQSMLTIDLSVKPVKISHEDTRGRPAPTYLQNAISRFGAELKDKYVENRERLLAATQGRGAFPSTGGLFGHRKEPVTKEPTVETSLKPKRD